MPLLNTTVEFQWNILNQLDLTSTFAWNVGDGIYYWYNVQSVPYCNSCLTCLDIPPDGYFTETLTIMATSVKGLAKQLRAQRYNRCIGSVCRWTRPVFECDIKNMEAAGINMTCPSFVSVDFCIPEMFEFIEKLPVSCPCGELTMELQQLPPCGTTNPNMWFTKYTNVTPSVLVGNSVIKGQVVGVAQSSTLGFGVYDCTVGGEPGVSIPIDQFYDLPFTGTPGGTETPTCLTSDQVARIQACVYWPVDKDWCGWVEQLGGNTGADYNAMTWACDGTTVLGAGPPRRLTGAYVFCASGGSSVNSVVYETGSNYVVVKHTDVGSTCCVAECIICQLLSDATSPAPYSLANLYSDDCIRLVCENVWQTRTLSHSTDTCLCASCCRSIVWSSDESCQRVVVNDAGDGLVAIENTCCPCYNFVEYYTDSCVLRRINLSHYIDTCVKSPHVTVDYYTDTCIRPLVNLYYESDTCIYRPITVIHYTDTCLRPPVTLWHYTDTCLEQNRTTLWHYTDTCVVKYPWHYTDTCLKPFITISHYTDTCLKPWPTVWHYTDTCVKEPEFKYQNVDTCVARI